MNQLRRASTKWSRLVGGIRPPSAAVTPKPFSTEASKPSLGSSDDQFLRTPSTGVVYGRLLDITKHTSKTDIINLLDASNLGPEKIKVEYNRGFLPLSMLVEFPSVSSYDAALRSIARKGHFYNIRKAEKSEWDAGTPYDGKAIILLGIPRNASFDDVERFLSGCQYDSSSIQISVRLTNEGPIRMALVRFPSQALAMHAYITKNRGFCLNNQITVQVLH
ncbi:uncharacterized protein LOC131016713 [Salvia miltiorrhiza]|uniref:uncharacterized protein LOC131016713 n=1 Tax=Salvia miltiorrhiza TaxID=226208 RepID=UPI0025ACA1E2|nr:uncharacterized protein LOC131016713 [Salvia miltiorrhiza]